MAAASRAANIPYTSSSGLPVIAAGSTRTYDMLKLRGGPEAIARGAATTTQMTDAIIAALERLGSE